MAASTTIVIELYDQWQKQQKSSWRKGAMLLCRGKGEAKDFLEALERKLGQVKTIMTEEDTLKYWYSHQVSALLIVLSQDKESGFKSVPRLHPCLNTPQDASSLLCVFLGPEKGAFAIEGYTLQPADNSRGVIKQLIPIADKTQAIES